MNKKQTPPKQIRLPDDLDERVQNCVKVSGISEAEVIRQAIKAGLNKLESGEYNPFLGQKFNSMTPSRWGYQADIGVYFAPEFDHCVPAGKWEEIDGDFKKVEISEKEIPSNFLRKNLFVVRVSGDSMTCKDAKKSIPDGARLLMVQDPDPKAGDIVIGMVDGNGSTLKELVVDGGKAYLKALNPAYPKIIPFEKLECQGVMVKILSDEVENKYQSPKKIIQQNKNAKYIFNDVKRKGDNNVFEAP